MRSTEGMVALCGSLLRDEPLSGKVREFGRTIAKLPIDERHYWIGTFYTLMVPAKVRREQAAYFTPPHLAHAVIDLVKEAGFDLHSHDILDPAAGGAAFLSTIAGQMLEAGEKPRDIVYRLNGIEIDPGLARISEMLIAERLGGLFDRSVLAVADALSIRPLAAYDLVIANPPYGRISPDLAGEHWRKIAHSGHINKYAVFTDLCFRVTKPHGLIALVIPSSFRAGPLYDRLRSYVRKRGQVLAIGSVESRDGVFIDVAQDVSVLLVRKGEPHVASVPVAFPIIGATGKGVEAQLQVLPVQPDLAWPTPMADEDAVGGATLSDYGVTARAGYFVWNRERHRLTDVPVDGAYPLIWAKNVKQGTACVPAGKTGQASDFVRFQADSQAIVRQPAAVMQRTTNEKQPRRLVAAMVSSSVVETWGGFVTENHTIVLKSDDLAMLSLAVTLLNTKSADERYRRVSGTAAVSVKLLRELDLPRPEVFRSALANAGGNAEVAAERAYAEGAKTGFGKVRHA